MLGSSEKSRQREQQAAHRLRERLLQLDTENKTLAMAASSRGSGQLSTDESQLDASALKEKLQKLQKLLLLATQRSSEEELQEQQQEAQQQELQQLRDEFERYKQRAQLVLKNKNAKDGCQSRELEEVRAQLAELKEKYISLRIQSEQAELQQRRHSEEQQQQALALQQARRQEAERLQALQREQLMLLEAELHKQRERTMALLDEKDRELETLRAAALSSARQADKMAEEQPGGHGPAPEGEDDALGQALRQVAPNEPTLLLYAEHLARKEVELGGLRRQKHRLEEQLHQLQAELLANAERHRQESSQLQGQLAKLLRDHSREGANLEYLKNIIYKFLTLRDASGRQQTLAAILTILHFSPQEKQSVMKLQASSWWAAGR